MSNKFLEIKIYYKPIQNNGGFIKIFGEDFVEANKESCNILYKGKEYELTQYFQNIEKNYNNKDTVNFILKITNSITSMKGMFYECISLFSLPDISKLNTSNVKDMSYAFYGCEYLSSFPDISKWNTSNVNDMSFMFY